MYGVFIGWVCQAPVAAPGWRDPCGCAVRVVPRRSLQMPRRKRQDGHFQYRMRDGGTNCGNPPGRACVGRGSTSGQRRSGSRPGLRPRAGTSPAVPARNGPGGCDRGNAGRRHEWQQWGVRGGLPARSRPPSPGACSAGRTGSELPKPRCCAGRRDRHRLPGRQCGVPLHCRRRAPRLGGPGAFPEHRGLPWCSGARGAGRAHAAAKRCGRDASRLCAEGRGGSFLPAMGTVTKGFGSTPKNPVEKTGRGPISGPGSDRREPALGSGRLPVRNVPGNWCGPAGSRGPE